MYKRQGERSGLSQSTWGSHDGNAAEEDLLPSRDLPADPFGEEETIESAVSLPQLTRTAKQYASMMKTGVSEMPVHTVSEKRKCASELADNNYLAGDPSGRL